MKGHFWLIVAASLAFLWWEMMEGLWSAPGSATTEIVMAIYVSRIMAFLQSFIVYAAVVSVVFAHAVLWNKNTSGRARSATA